MRWVLGVFVALMVDLWASILNLKGFSEGVQGREVN
jgi:hypothetical protein